VLREVEGSITMVNPTTIPKHDEGIIAMATLSIYHPNNSKNESMSG
jgi:hypothetical protein